jgi:hypothetical protein
MSDRHRPSFLNLFLKQRNHTSVAAQHISKPHCHKFRPGPVIHHLDHHLAEPLGCAHDISGVHGFVSGDQHKARRMEPVRCLCRLVSSKHIIFDCLIGTVFHQRHMLMRCRVIDNVRTILFKHIVDPMGIPHRTDQSDQIKIRIPSL